MTDVSKQRLLLATRNAHKTREVREILGQAWQVEDLTARPDWPEVEETGETFEANARLKAVAGSAGYDGWVLADDSGLEVDALDGAPGVRSARFAGEGADMAANRALLLERLREVRGKRSLLVRAESMEAAKAVLLRDERSATFTRQPFTRPPSGWVPEFYLVPACQHLRGIYYGENDCAP
jgi:inosine/xanthosine triphosphate pyrophosphatase family protein